MEVCNKLFQEEKRVDEIKILIENDSPEHKLYVINIKEEEPLIHQSLGNEVINKNKNIIIL
jgi:hypothetical protein